MKDAFNLRSPKTQYYAMWDVSILLNYLRNMNTDSDMNKSKKIVCLMMLLSGTQVNTITYLKVTNMYITDTKCTVVFDEVLKHSRPKCCQKTLNIQSTSGMSRFMSIKKHIKLSRRKINKIVRSSTFYFIHKTI